jgi:hypothetical protein
MGHARGTHRRRLAADGGAGGDGGAVGCLALVVRVDALALLRHACRGQAAWAGRLTNLSPKSLLT